LAFWYKQEHIMRITVEIRIEIEQGSEKLRQMKPAMDGWTVIPISKSPIVFETGNKKAECQLTNSSS